MKILLNRLTSFLFKLRDLYRADDSVLYRLRVSDCYYSEDQQEYIAILHTVGKRGSFKMSVREIVGNKKLLSQIHPIQASSLGWMARESHFRFAANDNQFKLASLDQCQDAD